MARGRVVAERAGITQCPFGHVPCGARPEGSSLGAALDQRETGDRGTGLQEVRHAGGRVGGLLRRVRHLPGLERQRRGSGAAQAGWRPPGARRPARTATTGSRPAAGAAAATGREARPGGGARRLGETDRGHRHAHGTGHVRGRRQERLDDRRLLHDSGRRPTPVAHHHPWRGEPAAWRAAVGAGDLLDHAGGAGDRAAGDRPAPRALGCRCFPGHPALDRGHRAPGRVRPSDWSRSRT